MWGRKKTDGKSSKAAVSSAENVSALNNAQAKTVSDDPHKSNIDLVSSGLEAQELLKKKIAELESELRSRPEDVDDLNSNLALAKESLR